MEQPSGDRGDDAVIKKSLDEKAGVFHQLLNWLLYGMDRLRLLLLPCLPGTRLRTSRIPNHIGQPLNLP